MPNWCSISIYIKSEHKKEQEELKEKYPYGLSIHEWELIPVSQLD